MSWTSVAGGNSRYGGGASPGIGHLVQLGSAGACIGSEAGGTGGEQGRNERIGHEGDVGRETARGIGLGSARPANFAGLGGPERAAHQGRSGQSIKNVQNPCIPEPRKSRKGYWFVCEKIFLFIEMDWDPSGVPGAVFSMGAT